MQNTRIYKITHNSNIFYGNIIPHSWYSDIVSESGKPDYNAISIFSEIIYWYRPSREGNSKFKGDAWQTSYEHFETRFGYHREKTRRALVRLEELGLIRRELRTIKNYGQKYSNVLFIHLLTIPNTITQNASSRTDNTATSSYGDPAQCFDNDSFDYNNQDIGCFNTKFQKDPNVEKTDNLTDKLLLKLDSDFISSTSANNALGSFFVDPLHKFLTPSPQICGEHYIEEENKEENKNRSDMHECAISKSNFLIISDLEKIKSQNSKQTVLDSCVNEVNDNNIPENFKQNLAEKMKNRFWTRITKPFQKTLDWPDGMMLTELANLSKEEVSKLNRLSKREFSQNFINQLVLKLGHKNPEHKFFKKRSFMNYMVKAIKNEMIQAPQANNTDFKFACISKTEEEKFQNRVSKYCEEVESSTSTLPDMVLKKKILGRLDPNIAYEVLNGTSITIDQKEDSLCKIKILRPLKIQGTKYKKIKELPEWIRQIIFEEVRGVYGQQVSKLEYIDLDDTNFGSSSCISNSLDIAGSLCISHNSLCSSDILCNKTLENLSPLELTWLRVKNKIKEIYGDDIYRSWFSGLKIVQNHDNNILRVEAPTSFIRDWVKKDYGHIVEREIKMENPSIQFVEFASNGA